MEFIFTPAGRAVPDAVGSSQYHYTDHLGNTRLSFSDLDGDGDVEATSEIVQEAHYYPFGMELMGLNTPQIGAEHAFKFNGKALQDEFHPQWTSMDWR